MVGCTEQNRPIIEESYRFVLDTLDRHVRHLPFLLGSRPSLADFGLYGQLQILSVDPTPAAEMRARAPDVFCWLMRLDDASGVEGDVDPGAIRSRRIAHRAFDEETGKIGTPPWAYRNSGCARRSSDSF